MRRSTGTIMLCIFLAIYGLLMLTDIHFDYENLLLGGSAFAASIFLAFWN